MISIGFFGCKRDQVVNCSWEEACDRFPLTGFTFPDASALASLSEVLTGSRLFSADPVPCSTEPFHELGGSLQAALRRATTEDLMDAGTLGIASAMEGTRRKSNGSGRFLSSPAVVSTRSGQRGKRHFPVAGIGQFARILNVDQLRFGSVAAGRGSCKPLNLFVKLLCTFARGS